MREPPFPQLTHGSRARPSFLWNAFTADLDAGPDITVWDLGEAAPRARFRVRLFLSACVTVGRGGGRSCGLIFDKRVACSLVFLGGDVIGVSE